MFGIFPQRRSGLGLLVLGITLLFSCSGSPVEAQLFGRAPGSPFGGRGGRGLLRELGSESVRAELQITPEQQLELDALLEAQRDNRDQFADIFQKYAAAKSEEERNQVREQMQTRFDELRKKADADAKAILTPAQAARLEQLHLHHEGPTIFTWDAGLAGEFGVTEEQKKQLASLGEQRLIARLALGRDAEEADRIQLQEEWNQKLLEVMTPEQQGKWKERSGPPPIVVLRNAPASVAAGEKPTAEMNAPAKEGEATSAPGTSTAPASDSKTPPKVMTLQTNASGSEPVVSFNATQAPEVKATGNAAATDPDASAVASQAPSDSVKKLSFNFRYAPWGDVLKLFAEEAGLSLDLNAIPPGTFNYYDRGAYSPVEALDILNGYLLPKGYCLLRRDDFLVCVNIDEPIPPSLVPNVSPSDLDSRGKNEMLTVIFPLEGVDVSQVAVEVNDIKGPQGKVVGLKSTNSILVTDIGSNLRRIRDLLRDVTARGGPNDITFKSYQVQHIDVADAEQIVRTLLGVTPAVTNVSAMNEDRRRGDPRGPQGNQPAPAPRADSSPVRVTIDSRTNQLLVTATLAQHLLVEQALKTIDIAGDPSQFSPSSNRPFLKVYQVTSADAREVTKTIDSLMPGIVVNEDARNRKIHIQASPEQHRQVEALIAQMDGVGGTRQMAVIPLNRLDPVSVTTTLRSMFLKDGDAAPTIEADYYGQQLMVRATAEQLTQIRTLLNQLGEDGTGNRSGTSNSQARTVPLAGRDPEELLPLILRMWEANNSAPIRVVTPPSRNKSAGEKAPASAVPQRNPPPQTGLGTSGNRPLVQTIPSRKVHVPVLAVAQTQPAENDNSAESALPKDDQQLDHMLDSFLEPQAASKESPAAETPSTEVNIVVNGDELFITSADPRQLDQLEELLQKTMQALPPRITWTVFTLQVADATEAANMLKLLFPGTSVSAASSSSGGVMDTLSSGASSLGSSLRDITGLGAAGGVQSLRIIPDNRLNALFVAGPAAQVREVEEMLKVLDATDLGGDSLREKLARLIPVEYASAEEVFSIVKDVYKNYIDPPRVQENNNPFAMLAGGGQRGGRGNDGGGPQPMPKLALGIDKSTSHIVVWADDALFHEIESLVKSMDEAALESRRTVRVVNLENTNSTVIQGALGSLMPQVKVSVTGTRQTSSSSSPAPTPPANTSSTGPDQDQVRQFFEQRMRERMMQGGGGENSGGGRGFGGGGFGGGGRGFGGGGRGGRGGQ